jgi:hypothetical protein
MFLKMTALNKHDVQCIHTYLCFIILLDIRFICFINNSCWFFRNFNYFIITTRIVFCILSNINLNLKWEFAGIGRNRIKRAWCISTFVGTIWEYFIFSKTQNEIYCGFSARGYVSPPSVISSNCKPIIFNNFGKMSFTHYQWITTCARN